MHGKALSIFIKMIIVFQIVIKTEEYTKKAAPLKKRRREFLAISG